MVTIASLCLLLFSQVILAASLELELSSHSVEMGKHLNATFTYKGDKKPNLIDLELWHDDFYIELADPDLLNTETDSIISTTKARLYPRHIGEITLDAIALGGSFVKPQSIKISPSIRNNIDATPQLGIIKSYYWADEPIKITINVPLHYARNDIIAKEWLINGFTITPLPSVKTATEIQLTWLIYSPLKGLYHLELPTIIQRGKGRFRFHLPKITFTIKPLPAYLPSSIATGLINISSKIINKNNKQIAFITLKKIGYLPKQIEGFQEFINSLSEDEISLNIQIENHIQNGSSSRLIKITLPEWLWSESLNLELKYFNPQTGRLGFTNHTLPKVFTLPKIAQYIFIALCIIFFMVLLKIISSKMQHWRDVQKLKQRIHLANDAQAIRLILLNNGQFKTLTHWAKQIETTDSIWLSTQLNQACFQAHKESKLTEIKATLTSKLTFNLRRLWT